MTQIYNNGTSTIDQGTGSRQINTEFYQKQALIEAQREQYFQQLADVTSMPKHFGKKIVKYHYIPMLDDQNVNDQGIDASGAVIADGNLYGSSKDIGVITDKLPLLSETGGRVNRVGFSRKTVEGTFEKFGFFSEYSQESLDFDTDEDLWMHINRETINGASEITEDTLQIDIINAAGVVRFAGAATDVAEVAEQITYRDLVHLNIDLDNNRTPKHTTIITGTRMVDTKVVPACRVMYVGSELLPMLKAMKDYHDRPAWKPVEQYAAGTTVLRGEEGSVDSFRVVVVPEMVKYAAGGAANADVAWYGDGANVDVFPMVVVGDGSFTTIGFQTGQKGTETVSGKSNVKFTQIHVPPGRESADAQNPYGELGFMSIKWFYGFMALRPERIALVLTAAKM